MSRQRALQQLFMIKFHDAPFRSEREPTCDKATDEERYLNAHVWWEPRAP